MGWFSRLKDKIRKLRQDDDVIYEGTLEPVNVPRETPKPLPVVEITEEGQLYLKENPDVAAHSYFGTRPFEHYETHGRLEGRRWPAKEAAPQPAPEPIKPKSPKVRDEHFTFGKLSDPLIYGTADNQKHAANFDYLMSAAGPVAAYDYLVKHIPGGAALYRSAAQVAGIPSEETARIVNKYGSRSAKGRIEGDEYVLGAPFTQGVRYKLPR